VLPAIRQRYQHSGWHRLLALYEAEDQYYGRLLGVAYAEIFRSAAPLLVEDPTVFCPVSQG
jgi:N-acetylglucosamine malate deacetylase 1